MITFGTNLRKAIDNSLNQNESTDTSRTCDKTPEGGRAFTRKQYWNDRGRKDTSIRVMVRDVTNYTIVKLSMLGSHQTVLAV